jgi:hypothetical protein
MLTSPLLRRIAGFELQPGTFPQALGKVALVDSAFNPSRVVGPTDPRGAERREPAMLGGLRAASNCLHAGGVRWDLFARIRGEGLRYGSGPFLAEDMTITTGAAAAVATFAARTAVYSKC